MNHFYSNLKLLLVALFAFMGVSVGVNAASTVTLKYTGTTTANMTTGNQAASVNLDATEWSVVADKGGNSNMPGLNKAGDIRLYYAEGGGNTITVSSLTGATIESIAMTFTGDNYSNVSVTVDGKGVSGEGGEFEINSSSFVLGNANTSNVQVRISQIVITYAEGTAPAVATPVITPATSTVFGDQTVTITCATEGAKIYYLKTVDFEVGSQMQKAYEEYTSPLTINYDNGSIFGKATKATISAYAVIPATSDAAEQTSETVEVTLTWATIYTSIAEANAAATKTRTDAGIQADNWLVTYVNGQYTYLTDGVAGLLLYGNDLGLEQGQKVSGLIKGQLYSYNGLPEVTNPNVDELEVMSEGNDVAPIVVAASKLQEEKLKWVNMFVTVTAAVSMDGPLNVAEGSAVANYNFGSEGAEFIVRNNFKIGITTKDVTMYDVTGFWALYNENGQMYPTAVTEYVDPTHVMGDVTSYYIQNPSFDLDEDGLPLTAEQKASNGALDIVGWTMSGVGTQFNNTEIRQANSTSTTSAFGTSDPSDGPYSLFFRQGWNRDGNVTEVTLETEAFELPEGQYIISVDYKQAYSYDKAGSKDTKIKLSLEYDDLNFGEAETEAAPVGNATYFNNTEWSTLKALVNVDFGDIDLAGSVSPILKITLYAAGDKRSDFFLDNVRIIRVSEEDISRGYLEDAINQATEMLEEPYGQLFTKVESAHSDLQASIEAAQDVYDDEAATADEIDQATRDLLTAMETYEGSDMILPDSEKNYSIKLKEGGNCYMNVSDAGTKLAEEPIALKFASTDLGWAISNADASYYAALTGTGSNVWSMGAATEAYDWYIEALPTGEYTIAKASNNAQMIGINSDAALAAETPCYCDKSVAGVGDRAKWIIEEFVEPLENPATVFTACTARGAWKYDAANNRMHYDVGVPVEDTPDDYKFAFIEKDGHKFLYSLGAKKFIQPQKYLLEGITTPVRLEPTGAENCYIIRAEKSNLTINIGGSQWTWDTWTTADDGNQVSILEVGEFDATEALAMLENTPLDQHKVYTVVTKRGQWAASADHESLASVATNPDATDADKQFAFYYDGADIYIYSVGAKKFFKNDGSFFGSKGDAVDYRVVAPLNNNDYDHCFFFTSNLKYFNMQTTGAYAINTWSSPDDGNRQKLTEVEGIDVFEEMETVFNTPVLDVTYEVYYEGKKVAEETIQQLDGEAVKIPEGLDRGLCTLTTDIETVNVDHKVVKVTATWNDLFQFSESFDNAVWYNMDIRDGWQVFKCESEPYTMKNDPTVDELASDEFQWAFAGDPYNLIVYNKSLSGSWTLTKDGDMAVMREGEFKWEPFANSDGFVMRAQGTTDQWINQSGGGGADKPLKFWAGGRTDTGSTFRVSEVPVILEGLNALKNYDLDGKDKADVVLRLADAKVTYVTTVETEVDGETVTYDAVVMEDATAGELIARVGLGDVLKVGDTVSGDIHLTKVAGYSAYLPNDKTAADLENLEITEGEAEPIAVNEDNVDAYAYNPSWYYAEFEGATFNISEDGNRTVTLPVMREAPFYVQDILGAIAEEEWPEDGTEGTFRGYIISINTGRVTIEFFQPLSFTPEETLDLAVDVERPVELGYEATTVTVDFAEALEFLGVDVLTTDMLYFVSHDGSRTSWADYDKAIDGWCNAEGDMQSWGANAFVCAKFFEAIPDGEFSICDMGGDQGAAVPAVGDEFSCQWALKVDNKVVVYTINVTFVEPPVKYLADYTEKGSFDVTIYAPEKGEAFDGEESEAFEEAAVSELIGEMWSEIYGKGVTDEVGETFATDYTAEPQPGFWFLEDGIADTEENGVFSVSLIPAEDWSTFTFQASTKEALENNLTTTFYLVNEETKEYVAYNITLSAKPAVNLVGEFDGVIKQILSHPQTGKQGEATGEQTVTIAEGEEEGTYDITYSGFTMPITGAELPEFTITGVEAEISEDGTTAKYVLPAWAPQSITIDRGTGTVTYKIAFEGTKDGNDTPVLKLTLDNSVIDDVYFGADEKTVDKAIAMDEATGINGINSLETAGNVFDLSGRKVQKVQKSGIYIVNGKKVSIK